MGYAALGAFWRLPTLKTWIDVDETRQFIETAFVFIGNNRYKRGLMPGVRRRPALNEGWLSILYLRKVGRLALIRIVLRSLCSQLRELPELEVKDAKQVIIETKKRRLRVALDGELTMLQPPLMLRIWPRSLRVIVPHYEHWV
jgi:diacylglycerol kinase family enzyme